MKNKNSLRVKNMMYEQQISHLPRQMNTVEAVFETVGKLAPKRFALAVHDHDISDDGNPAEAHLHVMMSFENARSLSSIAKTLHEQPQQIAKWDEHSDEGFAYLCHANPGSVGKFQYDPSTVLSNFDYPEFLMKYKANVQKRQKAVRVNDLLDALKNGSVSVAEIEQQMPGSLYAKYASQIERVNMLRLRKSAEEWRQKAQSEGKRIKLIWIYGAAGTGKTRLAKKYAGERNEPIFISGSSRDIFQAYAGQHVIILDELRPGMMQYSDLLRLTNPFGIDEAMMAPARYSDKSIAADLFIVTSPLSPKNFHMESNLGSYDDFAQLQRRIILTIRMTADEISRMEWSNDYFDYVEIAGSTVPNPYSAKGSANAESEAAELFSHIIL